MEIFILTLDRWLHIISGVVWVGLLYYFNFVQVPGMAEAKKDGTAAGISKHIAPRALMWFRYAALVTWITGFIYILHVYGTSEMNGFLHVFLLHDAAMGVGAWLGTIMLFNVWAIIWPCQKKVLGLVEADDASKLAAGKRALLASRTNTMLSFPMLYFMMVAGHRHLNFG